MASEEIVINAIAAFKEAIANGGIEKPGAFDLAKVAGIVKTRDKTDQGFIFIILVNGQLGSLLLNGDGR